jgi:hypothetical protein
MMHFLRILIIIPLLPPSSLLYSQNAPTSLIDYYPTISSFQLKGKVKSCHIKEFELKNNSEILSQTSTDIEKLTFLPNGSIDENISYLNGSFFKKTKYNRISPFYIEIANEHALGKAVNYNAVILDSTGKIQEYYEDFVKEGSGFKSNIFYVKKCLLNQKFYYNNYTKPDSIISFENKKIFTGKSIYKYSSEKLPIEETLILNDPIGNKLSSYQYDKDQRIIEVKTSYLHTANKQSEIFKYAYNTKGNLESQTNIFYSDAVFNTIDNSIIYRYKYEYDNQGNWIKATKFEGNKIESITVRTILYY